MWQEILERWGSKELGFYLFGNEKNLKSSKLGCEDLIFISERSWK